MSGTGLAGTTELRPAGARAKFLWFEITGRCNFECIHCYAESSPAGDHGSLPPGRWFELLEEAVEFGVEYVQFIGGEPTLHPSFRDLVGRAHALGLDVEVYTNLFSLPESTLTLYETHNVSVATSFYDQEPAITARITKRFSDHDRLVKNIQRIIARGIPLRVGLIKICEDQDVSATLEFLRGLGVKNTAEDGVRSVGRASSIAPVEFGCQDKRQHLCGKCANGKAAITPNGDVFPCVFSRWLPVGNVRNSL